MKLKRLLVLVVVTSATAAALQAQSSQYERERSKIAIENTGGQRTMTERTTVDAGPSVGDMLNFHFFPGLQDYGAGMYSYAERQMTYVIDKPEYLSGNVRAAEFMSTAHYIRAMVFAHHAKGIGARNLARSDFEAAIHYNPRNYVAYLELSRMYINLGFKPEAQLILNRLVELKPDEKTLQEARKLLTGVQSGASK